MLIIQPDSDFINSPHYEEIKALYRKFYEEEIALHNQINNGYVPEWSEFDTWLENMGKYGNVYLACTTTAEGAITGLTFFSIGYIDNVPMELSLCMVYVAVEHRRKGYATELLEYVVQTAEERNVPRIELTVVGVNLPAIKLYSKFGFFTSFYYMNRKIA